MSYVETTRAASGPGLSAQTADKGTFPVDSSGDYKGDVPAGTYTVIYRTPGMTPDKQADTIENVMVAAGQDVAVDDRHVASRLYRQVAS